jgi:hypothetical protein
VDNGKTNITYLKECLNKGIINDEDIQKSLYSSLKSERLILKNSITQDKAQVQSKEALVKAIPEKKIAIPKKTKNKKDRGIGM